MSFFVQELLAAFYKVVETLLGHYCIVALECNCWTKVIVSTGDTRPVGESSSSDCLPCLKYTVNAKLGVDRLHSRSDMVHDLHHTEVFIVHRFNHFAVKNVYVLSASTLDVGASQQRKQLLLLSLVVHKLSFLFLSGNVLELASHH